MSRWWSSKERLGPQTSTPHQLMLLTLREGWCSGAREDPGVYPLAFPGLKTPPGHNWKSHLWTRSVFPSCLGGFLGQGKAHNWLHMPPPKHLPGATWSDLWSHAGCSLSNQLSMQRYSNLQFLRPQIRPGPTCIEESFPTTHLQIQLPALMIVVSYREKLLGLLSISGPGDLKPFTLKAPFLPMLYSAMWVTDEMTR